MDSLCKSLLAVLIAATTISGGNCARAEGSDQQAVSAGRLVELLGHQAYQTRTRARRQLLDRGLTDEVRTALGQGLKSKSLERHEACFRLLQHFEFQAFNQELEKLTSPHVSAGNVRLLGWSQFSAIAGDDVWSRRLYSRIARQHYPLIRQLMRSEGGSAKVEHRFLSRADPYRLANHDAVSWAFLLFCDSIEIDHAGPELSPSILNSLSHSGLGPSRAAGGDMLVIQRLVDQWIVVHPNVGSVRDRLLVAMRYQCKSRAGELSQRTLTNGTASASALATAMLCASVLGQEDLRQQLIARLDDDRTAHIWQLIASRKTKIRTQVRDVALALLLHDRGIDPRQVGYIELQADPLLLFRDHSLGFADDPSREAAHRKGRAQLGI